MKLVISQLKAGENPLNFNSEIDSDMKAIAQDLQSEGYRLQGPLKFEGTLHKHEPDYYLNGHLNWCVEQECSRCAENFSSPMNHRFQLALAHDGSHQTKEDDDLDIIFFKGTELDLKPVLHEQFVLSLPFKALCQETCKGICQHCGKNLNRQECECATIPRANPFSVLKTVTL